MKYTILLVLIAFAVSKEIVGLCTMAPKRRPLRCYTDKVLKEDIPELKKLLAKFKKGGNDNEFANYLGDMFDKKEFREGKKTNEEDKPKLIGKCGMHPKYLKYECYEPNVLRRHRVELKEAYEKYHESNLDNFNKIYEELREKKLAYFQPKVSKIKEETN